MSKSTKRRSARTRRLKRERQQRDVRHAQAHPLRTLQPPFRPYAEWFSVPPGAAARMLGRLPSGSEAEVHAIILRIAPLYAGELPLAAIYLEQQILRGTLHIAHPVDPELVSLMPVADVAVLFAVDEVLRRARRMHPGALVEEPDAPADVVDCGTLLHELHFHGALVLDNEHVITLASLV